MSVCLCVCLSVGRSVGRCSQTASRNSCSIVSGDVSNCSYVSSDSTSCHEFVSQFGLAFFLYAKTSKSYCEDRPSLMWLLNGPAAPVTMRSRLNGQRPVGAATTAVILSRDRLSQNSENQPVETATMRVYTFMA